MMPAKIGFMPSMALPCEQSAREFSNIRCPSPRQEITGFLLRHIGFTLMLLLLSTGVLAAPNDQDEDGVPDLEDNCIYQPNGPLVPDAGGQVQRDTDADGYGNVCDADFDNDGAVGFPDLGYMKSVFFTADAEADLDGDGAVGFPDLGLLKSMFFQEPGPSGLLLQTLTTSSVLSDEDETYPTGQVVRIDVQTAADIQIQSATARVTSASQAYDSGEQQLLFGSLYYLWETAGLASANDYVVTITIVTLDGQTIIDNSLTVTLDPNPPVINKLVSETDVSFPSVGIPVQFQRTYLLDSEFDGPMGYGWTHNYRMRLVIPLALGLVAGGGGTLQVVLPPVQVFNADGTGSWFFPNADGTYRSPKGDFRTLTRLSNGVYSLRTKYGMVYYFSSNGKLFRIVDRNNNAVTLQYDGFDMLDSVTDASGQVTTFTYDGNNRIWAVTDPAGRTATYAYDAADNLATATDIGGNTTTYSYDAQHNLTTITDPLGKRTFFTADSQDRLQSMSGESGQNSISLQYGVPAVDQMTMTDAVGSQTILTYDNNASITWIVDPNGNVIQIAYDADLNLRSLTDPNGGQTTLTYDGQGNVLTTTDAQGNSITLSYEPLFNQLSSLIDARGNTISYGYDANGNLTSVTYPNGTSETYTYDSSGDLATQTDRKSQTITFSYDSAGRLTQKTFPDSSADNFTYDLAGNLTSTSNSNGTINFIYDSLDRLIQVTYPGGEVVSYGYDAASNRTRLTYPNGKALDYSYDAFNQLTQISEAGQMVAGYTYDALSRVTRRNLHNGTFSTYSYDSTGQLLDLINSKSSSETISSFAYTYDDIGNRLTMTTLAGTAQYIYDFINQLTSVVLPGSSTNSYNLDAAGNRVSVAENGTVTAYTTNNLNQYTSAGGDAYVYDANGNLTSKTTSTGTITYNYDYENRLVQMNTLSENIQYEYDPFGRRVTKSTAAGTTRYIHDDMQVIQEQDGSGALIATYMFGRSIDEILQMTRGALDYFYSHDALGSVTELTDSSENLIESYSYGTYGIPSATSLVGNPYLYTGREYESETGLMFYRARFYDPHLGRFITTDPIGVHGGINLYAYVDNNPINFVDPTGELKWWAPIVRPIISSPIGIAATNLFVRGTIFLVHSPLGRYSIYGIAGYIGWGFGQIIGNSIYNLVHPNNNGIWVNAFGNPMFPNQPQRPPNSTCPPFCNSGNPGNQGTGSTCQDPDPANCPAPCDGGLCVPDPSFVQKPWGFEIGDMTAWLKTVQRDALAQGKQGLVAKLVIPYEEALVRADVPVFGLAFGEGFQDYRVEYGEGTEPSEWITLATSTTPQSKAVAREALNDSLGDVIQGNLATWDTGLTNYFYPATHPKGHPIDLNGPYTLRLVVTGEDGKMVEDRVSVNVTNVIPNAWGGIVRSKDRQALLSVPEQALRDIFRLISIQPAKILPAAEPAGRQLVGGVYEVRELTERFTKEAVLQLAYTEAGLGGADPARVGVYGYNAQAKAWEYLPSLRHEGESVVKTKVRQLHPYYALMTSDDVAEGSRLEPAVPEARAIRKVSTAASGPVLVRDSFETDTGEWSNRDHEVGGAVALDDPPSLDGSQALRITNTDTGGNFAVNVVTTPFDARDYPVVEFDYRIPADVKTNFLVKVAGRWYEIGFTDDAKDLHTKDVNIAHIGDIEGVVADDRWRAARFNLYDMLRTKTGHTVVEQMIMADWDVSGFMRLHFGSNKQGATYFIDNFSISRDPLAGVRMAGDRLLIDDFDQDQATNGLNGATYTYSDGAEGKIKVDLVRESTFGTGESLKLSYDVTQPNSFAGYITEVRGLDLRDYQVLDLSVKGAGMSEVIVIVKDQSGQESYVALKHYLTEAVDEETWQKISIPLTAFSEAIDWSRIELLSVSFSHAVATAGTLLVDDIALVRKLDTLLVDDFHREDRINRLGGEHTIFMAGMAAINGVRMMNSPNAVYGLAYGGNIGDPIPGQPGVSSAGWTAELGGIDCSACGVLSFRIRGLDGGERPNLYLGDGNFRWGLDLEKYSEVSTEWQAVSIPLEDFAAYGVDLTHLTELVVHFEWEAMSGTVFLDDIRFGEIQN